MATRSGVAAEEQGCFIVSVFDENAENAVYELLWKGNLRFNNFAKD